MSLIRDNSITATQKERSLKWLLAIMIVVFFAYGFINLIVFSFPLAGVTELGMGFVGIALYHLSRFTRWHHTISIAIALLSGILLWGLSAIASYNDHSILIWVGLFPLIAFYLLGVRNGLIAHVVFSVSIFFFLLWKSSVNPETFNAIDLTNIGGALIVFGLLAWLFELNRSEALQEALSRAMFDELTGAGSRKLLYLILTQTKSHSSRHSHPISLILIDLDHFKNINDTYGHLTGDTILKTFADLLRSKIREEDTLIRWGGEEFIIVAPNTDDKQASTLAEKLRRTIEEHSFGIAQNITASFGVTHIEPNESEEATIHRADTALYRAKENGRNCVEAV
jgi:diguanylate cyclase (GGDEF)-like protein